MIWKHNKINGGFCLCCFISCLWKKDTTVSANKDGVLYEAGVGVSFYYPSDFKLSEGNPMMELHVLLKKIKYYFIK